MSRLRVGLCFLVISLLTEARQPTAFEPWSPCHEHRAKGQRALVTGITGMLGSHVAEALLLRGYEVYGVARARSNLRNIATISSNITIMSADLTDPFRVRWLVKEAKPRYIFHFAAQAINSMSFTEPAQTLNTNIMSTLNLLEAVRDLGLQTRLFIASSSTVYGKSVEQWNGPIPEEAQLQPVSPYGVSKAATEMLALQYERAHGLDVVVGRFFIHLAPRGVEALAMHEFARQIATIELGWQEPVIQHGDLDTQRDITDIVDSAPVVACIAEAAPRGTVVNIGSNIAYTMREILQQAIELSRAPKTRLQLDSSRLRAYDERVVMANISRLQAITGWRPQPDMDHLIGLLLAYWRQEVLLRREPSPLPRKQQVEL